MIWAQFHSATVSLDAFGETREQALSALTWEWQKHAKVTNQDPDMLSKRAEHVKFLTIKKGSSFIDIPRPVVKGNKPGPEAIGRYDDDSETTG